MRSGGTPPCIGGMRARERTSVLKSELLSCERREVSCVACSRRAASRMRACTRVAAASRASLSARACCSVRFASQERALACRTIAFIISCIARCSFSALHRSSRRRWRRRNKRHSIKAPSKAPKSIGSKAPSKAPISMLPLLASGNESSVLMVGGVIVTMVRDVMVGVDVTVSPKKELATDAFEMEEAILSSMAAVAFAVAVVMMMSTRVDAALAITWTLLGPTPSSAATQTAMLFSRAVVNASIGSAATKPITTWSVIVVIDPGTAGDGGGGSEGGDGSSGHSARIEL